MVRKIQNSKQSMCAYQDDVQQLGWGDIFVIFRQLGILVGVDNAFS